MTDRLVTLSPDEGVDCRICGCRYLRLTRHLLRHNLTVTEYRRAFPGAPLTASGEMVALTPPIHEHMSLVQKDLYLDRYGVIDPRSGEWVVRRWTPELAVARLQRLAMKLGRVPVYQDLTSVGRQARFGPPTAKWPSVGVCKALFGSFSAALAAAGFDAPPRLRRTRIGQCENEECSETFVTVSATRRFCSSRCRFAVARRANGVQPRGKRSTCRYGHALASGVRPDGRCARCDRERQRREEYERLGHDPRVCACGCGELAPAQHDYCKGHMPYEIKRERQRARSRRRQALLRAAARRGALAPVPASASTGRATADEEPDGPQDQQGDQHEPQEVRDEPEPSEQGEQDEQSDDGDHGSLR